MATVVEKAKEALVGLDEGASLSAETRNDFLSNAVQDEETGAYYLDRTHFIDAIAPEGEDYVSIAHSVGTIAMPELMRSI